MADDAQLKIRLNRALKAKVDAAADQNGRTLNAEIAARLERTFIEDHERSALEVLQAGPSIAEDLAHIAARLARIETRLDEHSTNDADGSSGERVSASMQLLINGRP